VPGADKTRFYPLKIQTGATKQTFLYNTIADFSDVPKYVQLYLSFMHYIYAGFCDTFINHLKARLAQSVARETLNLKVVGSSPTSG
jgi:hypothetical protein